MLGQDTEAAFRGGLFFILSFLFCPSFEDSKLKGVNVACEAKVYFEWNESDEKMRRVGALTRNING
jgi:hypothetical protein